MPRHTVPTYGGSLLSASSSGVMEKLLFGSGFPNETPARTIETVYSVNAYSHGTQLPSIARASIKAIVEKDSLACLGIDAEIASRPAEPEEVEESESPVVDVVRRSDPAPGRAPGPDEG